MGKKITVYLTDSEMEMLEKLCSDQPIPNQSRIIKKALKAMFDGGLLLKEGSIVEHSGDAQAPVLITGGSKKEMQIILAKEELKKINIVKSKEVENKNER